MDNKVQKLTKSLRATAVMPHPTRNILMAICAAELLGLSFNAVQEKDELLSDY